MRAGQQQNRFSKEQPGKSGKGESRKQEQSPEGECGYNAYQLIVADIGALNEH